MYNVAVNCNDSFCLLVALYIGSVEITVQRESKQTLLFDEYQG